MALRIALRQKRFSQFGEAWKNDEKWSYYINRNRLEQYLKAEGVNNELYINSQQRADNYYTGVINYRNLDKHQVRGEGMKTKAQILEEIKELESNIKVGKEFAKLGYPAGTLIAASEKLLEKAKEELEELETKEV